MHGRHMTKNTILLAFSLIVSVSASATDVVTCPPVSEPSKTKVIRSTSSPHPNVVTVECNSSAATSPPQISNKPSEMAEPPSLDWIDRGLTFLERILATLAWPVVVLTLLVKFRDEIRQLLERIAHLKFKDFELDFQRLKEQAERVQATELQTPRPRADRRLASFEDQLLATVESAPSAAVLLAWTGVEASLSSAVARLAVSPDAPSYRSPLHNIEALKGSSKITRDQESLLNGMRMLRNKLAHDPSATSNISEDQALSYAVAALELIQVLESLHRDG